MEIDMNPAYAILCNGTKINFSEVFKMAHRRAKHEIANGGQMGYRYAFKVALGYAMIWARSIAEVNGRI
jgi:hypothetical protein